jgi:hypothetical protein
MSGWTSRSLVPVFLSVLILLFVATTAAAQVSQPASKGAARLVTPAALAKLLPAPDGWTRGDVRSGQVEISSECNYTAASVPLTKGEARVKITLADTGSHADVLIALASLVVTLPDDCVQEVPPATTIKRAKINGLPTAEMWDATKLNGEITVVINDRFVVAIEAQKAENLDALRAVLASVDLKALGALK